MNQIVLFGSGNVASHLYKAFSASDQAEVIQVFARDTTKADFISEKTELVSDYDELKPADLYLLAVSDDGIAQIASELKDSKILIAHTSGSTDLSVLENFGNHGVFYPLQTFSKSRNLDYSDIPFCLEANSEENLEQLKTFAKFISSSINEVDSEQRRALHLSAVFVNNFSNHMFALGSDICQYNGLNYKILQPLIKETVLKLNDLPPKEAQTGPAIRNDQETIQKHINSLTGNQRLVYQTLTDSIQKFHGKKL